MLERLSQPDAAALSDRAIARALGIVSQPFVSKLRRAYAADLPSEPATVRTRRTRNRRPRGQDVLDEMHRDRYGSSPSDAIYWRSDREGRLGEWDPWETTRR